VDLTATERAWLAAALPVLRFAREQRLPLDIIVQPQPTPGETPLGMAYVDGRCKLVLSMRGNPEAQATLDRMGPALRNVVVEAIAAHELGHCWRHVTRRWGTLPDGVRDISGYSRISTEQAALLQDMWRTRREEGFADLVGLAWTLQHHPHRYDEVHDWHARLRAEQEVSTGPHDTRVWVRLAADKTRFKAGATIFEQVHALWLEGMLASAPELQATRPRPGALAIAQAHGPGRSEGEETAQVAHVIED
jgi:hypothetical protein